MRRSIVVLGIVSAAFAASSFAVAQDASQQGTQNDPYAGVSHPPQDDIIITTNIPAPKPAAGQPVAQPSAPAAPAQPSAPPPVATVQQAPQPTSVDPSVNFPAPQPGDGTDDGIVQVAPSSPMPQPMLSERMQAPDPDGDIVHPNPLQPGELGSGTSIWVHLLDRLSTVDSEKGDPFRSRVAMDVFQGGQVLIPTGSEIDGHVVEVSSGHTGGHGTMRLQPEVVILPDGTRYRLHAEVSKTLDSHTHVVGEGTIRPNSRARRDAIEYGGGVGAGVITGAVVGGPVGALTGGLIGAGAVTVHLMVSHPQATLESGSTLVFHLTDPLFLTPAVATGN